MLEEESNNLMPLRRGGANTLPWVILAVVLLVFVVAGVLFRDRLFPSQKTGTDQAMKQENSSGYQAVFLSNGQVYFGKLSGTTSAYATLTDIYYLQVTTPPLQGSQTGQAAQQQQQLSLVKLGQELHGPVDSMKINKDQILFFEDMKEDGKVMQAIREYQKNPPAANQTQTTPANTPATTPATPPANTPAVNSNTNK